MMESLLLCDEVWLCSPTTTKSPTTPPTTAGICCSEPSFYYDSITNCFSSSSIIKEEWQQCLEMCIEKEAAYIPEPGYVGYLHRSANLSCARYTAIQWLLKSCSSLLNLSVSTLFSASNYLDRFMSMHPTLKWETWMVELVTVACLSIASKFNDTNAPPSLYDFQMEEMEHFFQPNTIQQMELLLLQSLQWRLNSTTCHSYVELLLLSIAEEEDSSTLLVPKLHRQLSATASRFLVQALLECKFVEYGPSSVAISAVWCSMEELASSNPHYYSHLTRIIPLLLDRMSTIHKDEVIRCHGMMVEIEKADCVSSKSAWNPVTVLCRDRGVNNRDDSHVDLAVFSGNLGSGRKLGNKKQKKKKKKKKKKRKWEDS